MLGCAVSRWMGDAHGEPLEDLLQLHVCRLLERRHFVRTTLTCPDEVLLCALALVVPQCPTNMHK